MAETAATTRPTARKRATAPVDKPAPAQRKASAAATGAAAPVVGEDGRARFTVALEPHPVGPTKGYARFVPPASSGCVGTFYAPLGTEEVKVLLIGPAAE